VATRTSYRLVNGSDSLTLSGGVATSPIMVLRSEFTPARPRVVDQDRSGRSGKIDVTSLYGEATFSAVVRIQGDADMTRYDYLDLLKGYLVPSMRPYLYFQRDGWLGERRALLRGEGVNVVITKTSGQYLEADVRVVIPDGVVEDNEASSFSLFPNGSNIGWSYNASYPKAYTPASSGNSLVVSVVGNVPTPPYIRIYGTCAAPRIRRVLPDQTATDIYMPNLSLESPHYIDIDVENRRVFLDGVVANSYLSLIDFSVSDWFDLQPGDNNVLFTAASASAGCYAEVSYRNRRTP